MQAKARRDSLIVKELDGELAIYDEINHNAHELNRTAATVWRCCDGETPVAEIAAAVARESDLPADEEIVELAISQLARAGLMEDPAGASSVRVSRRQLTRRLGIATTVAMLLPVVTTIVAPTPAMAQSATPAPSSPPGTPAPVAPPTTPAPVAPPTTPAPVAPPPSP
jgi:hypothetical protein